MEKLNKILTLIDNNSNCIVFKVLKDKRIDLITLGYFTGNEDMIRITKQGYTHTITIFYNDGKSVSYDFGSSTTCVSESLRQIRFMMVDYIKKYYNITLY